MSDIMLAGIGGSVAPLIHSIEHYSSEKNVFFVYRDSRNIVRNDILPAAYSEAFYQL